MGDLIGYARVSTGEQNPALQMDDLKSAGCVKIFTDKASGTLERRPQLDRLLDQLRPTDTVVVWRLDRLARSLKHLVAFVEELSARNVGFKSLNESIDTSSANGILIFQIFAALSEFERNLIRERTHAGLAAARARGRQGGRPSVMTPDKTELAQKLYDERRHSVEAIAQMIGVSRKTVYRALARAK